MGRDQVQGPAFISDNETGGDLTDVGRLAITQRPGWEFDRIPVDSVN